MTPTLKDIAQAAGVSHPTVSRALRNSPLVNQETRERIQALAKKMGYQPNPALSALIAYRNATRPAYQLERIAILCDNADEQKLLPNVKEQILGIRERSKQLGFSPEVFGVKNSIEDQKRVSRILYNRGFRGVILTAMRYPLSAFEWHRFYCCGISLNTEIVGLNYVAFEHHTSLEETYRQVKQCGYKRIGYMNRADSEARNLFQSQASYLNCCYRDAMPVIPPLVYEKGDEDHFVPWLRKHKVDAVISQLNMISFLKGSEFRVPETLGYAFCGMPPSIAQQHQFSAFISDGNRLGALSVDLLQTLINKNQYGLPETGDRFRMLVEGYWQPGKTLKPVAKSKR